MVKDKNNTLNKLYMFIIKKEIINFVNRYYTINTKIVDIKHITIDENSIAVSEKYNLNGNYSIHIYTNWTELTKDIFQEFLRGKGITTDVTF